MSETPPTYSNYPRGPFQIPGSGRPPGVYFDAIKEAWNLMGADRATYAVAALAYIGVFFGLMFPINMGISIAMGGPAFSDNSNPRFDIMAVQQVVGLFVGAIGNMLLAGISYMALMQLRGERFGVGDVFAGFNRFGAMIGVCILQYLATAIGLCFCLVPGFFIAGALAFAPLLVLDQGLDPVGAIKTSYQALRRDAWSMFAFLFVAGLLTGLGVCACGVGFIFTLPLLQVGIAIHYLYYFPPSAPRYGIGPTVG